MRENDALIREISHTSNTIGNSNNEVDLIGRKVFSNGVINSVAKYAVKFNYHITRVMKIDK